ncbi:MAG: ABC transporter permease [Candidatus Nitricoxidivorans perseverans]|uniref:Transport permease protein n=1 Tax=Candidatus Nitricoxidivorans perseverans TaxID=2975601 RepID=A0AA49FIR1_9PROT|nr:MAG: ABC transporter permease [Candidatus Nitricoxidivorans perseverans]
MRFVLALIYRNFVAARSSARLTLIRVVFQPTIYLFVFGHVVGRMISGAGQQGAYAEIMAPGIIAMTTVSAPFVTIGGQVLSGYFSRTLEEWLLAPVTLRTVLLAMVTAGVCSGVVNSLVVATLVWLILGLTPANPAYVLLAVMAGALLFSLVTLVVLLLPQRPDRGQEVFSFLMMPMTFFGCTFYSYSMLEPPFSYLALLLPTTYISEGLRAAYVPDQPHMDADAILAGLFLAAAVLIPVTDRVFRRRLGHFSW